MLDGLKLPLYISTLKSSADVTNGIKVLATKKLPKIIMPNLRQFFNALDNLRAP